MEAIQAVVIFCTIRTYFSFVNDIAGSSICIYWKFCSMNLFIIFFKCSFVNVVRYLENTTWQISCMMVQKCFNLNLSKTSPITCCFFESKSWSKARFASSILDDPSSLQSQISLFLLSSRYDQQRTPPNAFWHLYHKLRPFRDRNHYHLVRKLWHNYLHSIVVCIENLNVENH